MLTVFLLTINSLRFALPVVTLFGTAPTVISFWFLIRSVTYALFPPHIYRRCDDHLYSMYQRLILFFFQNWVNVKVSLVIIFFFFSVYFSFQILIRIFLK